MTEQNDRKNGFQSVHCNYTSSHIIMLGEWNTDSFMIITSVKVRWKLQRSMVRTHFDNL